MIIFGMDYYQDKMYLSQSGQLYSEAGIMSFGKVYDFGPVFRAEKSKTRHHLSELWMMDAEMAYYDQNMNMDLQERMIKRIIKDILENAGINPSFQPVKLKNMMSATTETKRFLYFCIISNTVI